MPKALEGRGPSKRDASKLALAGCRRRRVARYGRVAEWFKALVLKTSVGESLPWVRIPPLPPFQDNFINYINYL